MFSAVGMMPITRHGRVEPRERAASPPATAAPPDMSSFMRSMPSAGLIEMPPESNVMPLPTSPSTGVVGRAGGSCRSTIRRGGSALPCATPSSRPMLQLRECAPRRARRRPDPRRRAPLRRARQTRAASARCPARSPARARSSRLADDAPAPHGLGDRAGVRARRDDHDLRRRRSRLARPVL